MTCSKLSSASRCLAERDGGGRSLVEFFEAHDREVWLDEVGNVRAPADDGYLLTSHIDTVPVDIPVRVEDDDEGDVLWGRGSVDAKGPLCAMAVAAVRTGASFVGVVGEEVDSTGARFLVEDRESEPGAVINGEPSGWEGITLGYRGLLAGTMSPPASPATPRCPVTNAIRTLSTGGRRLTTSSRPTSGTRLRARHLQAVEFNGGTSSDGLSVEATRMSSCASRRRQHRRNPRNPI